ncbi:hypothetical protein MIMGU_mgv1a010909mg [Erythranthe guttata]|uniref:F-box domain-containing protein n=1 Tax=Erythranthe guttata TaxID=4155 RepID=A0A022QVA5_ERYGU|nr:hypothetical protein MIMGU_mgv1a010909mg [Erythranthe guttata]
MQQLPEDVIEEILSRLHVKDLMRFKSVSKKWNSIISSQHLINLHLKKSISSPSHRRIFIPHSKSVVYKGLQDDTEELPLPPGAIAIRIWNPATRVSKTADLKLKFDNFVSWFGRESSDDEYKLILGIRPHGKQLANNHTLLVTLYVDGDSSNFSAQEIDLDQLVFKPYEEGTFFCGINHLCGLGVVDRCLSAICGNCEGFCVIYEVWIMKEYGIKESWTKSMNIPHPAGNIQYMYLVGVSDYGDIFFRSSTEHVNLFVYNVGEKKYTATLVSDGYFVKTYVETLVSPNLGKKRTVGAT